MLKRLAILVIIGAFAVEAMPAHNQVSGKRSASQERANQTPPSATAPIINNQATTYYERDRKDGLHGWHKFVTWPEGITAWLIMLTLGAIVWQAIATARAANAALMQANHLAASERAWVTVMPYIWSPDFYPVWEHGDPIPPDPKGLMPTAHQLPMKIKNVGNTPAKIEGLAAHYIRIPKPPTEAMSAEPDYGEIDHEIDGRFLIPNDELAITPRLMPKATLTKIDVKAIQCQDEFLYAYGIVFYRDVFDVLHETRWGYVYRFPQGVLTTNDKAVFDPDGPNGYNKHT